MGVHARERRAAEALKTRDIRAEAVVRERKGHGAKACIPFSVRDALGASPGDKIIFEIGCERTVQLAALLKTPYVIMRVVRSTSKSENARATEHMPVNLLVNQ
jgi:hypothetical protein